MWNRHRKTHPTPEWDSFSLGVTPTPNQTVHMLTATATESGWSLVGGDSRGQGHSRPSREKHRTSSGVHALTEHPRAPTGQPGSPGPTLTCICCPPLAEFSEETQISHSLGHTTAGRSRSSRHPPTSGPRGPRLPGDGATVNHDDCVQQGGYTCGGPGTHLQGPVLRGSLIDDLHLAVDV